MNEDFVTYELAVKLKEKGFDAPCYGYYHRDGGNDSFELCGDRDFLNSKNKHRIAAPTIPQVLKWLREEQKLHVEVMFIRPLHNRVKYYITDTDGSRGDFMDVSDEHYETWEQATLAGIEYVLDNLI